MFKALMVLTFGVISNKVCYTLVCFYMLFFFGYTMLLFVEDYLNKLQDEEEIKDRLLAWMEEKTIKSSTVQYARLLDFFH